MSKFVHMELNTSDPGAAQKFYKAIFGWKFTKMKMADGSVYLGIKTGEDGIGGVQKNPSPEAPSHWLGYVGVESIKKTTAKVEKGGGRVLMGEMAIPNMGSLAVYTDPQGAVFAVWQAAMRAPETAPEPAKVQQAPVEAAPAKAKKTAKKAGGKQAKQEAPAPEAAPAKAKKTAKKAGKKAGGKQAKQEAPAPEPAPKKATKKKAVKKG